MPVTPENCLKLAKTGENWLEPARSAWKRDEIPLERVFGKYTSHAVVAQDVNDGNF